MWAIFALAAALLTSFNPILYKRMLRETPPIVVVWGVIGLALPLLALTGFALTPAWPQVDGLCVLAIFGSAMLNALAHVASARSLRLADASLVTPLLTFSLVFTVFVSALFLGETPNTPGLVGVSLVLMGAYWLNREPGADRLTPFKSISARPGVALVLSAGLMWAITPVMEKLAIRHTFPESPRLVALVVNGPVGYVTTLFRLSAVFTVIWSAWLLGESGLQLRLPASIVMVTGAILISA